MQELSAHHCMQIIKVIFYRIIAAVKSKNKEELLLYKNAWNIYINPSFDIYQMEDLFI